MRQWVNLGRLAIDVDLANTGKSVGTLNVHGAGSADTLAAGATEGERRIDVILDPDQRVENHRPAIAGVDIIGVDMRVLSVVRIPAINFVFLLFLGVRGARPGLAFADFGILR